MRCLDDEGLGDAAGEERPGEPHRALAPPRVHHHHLGPRPHLHTHLANFTYKCWAVLDLQGVWSAVCS